MVHDGEGYNRREAAVSELSVVRAERRAWLVLISAFIAFWLVMGVLAFGALWYVRHATEIRNATLQVVSGDTVFVRSREDPNWRQASGESRIREGDTVRTRGDSKAFIGFFDGSNAILFPGSELRIEETRNARFLSRIRTIRLVLLSGSLRVSVASSSDFPRVHFEVDTPSGTLIIRRPEGASVRVDVKGDAGLRSLFMVRRGEATVTAMQKSVRLTEGSMVVVPYGREPTGPSAAGLELIRNGNFQAGLEEWQINRPEAADGTELNGEVYLVDAEGSRVVRFARLGGNTTHADLGIAQDLNVDVSDFEELMLRLRIRIDYQSLSGGGVMASEYPLIVKVTYKDAFGRPQEFYRGFYYQNKDGNPVENGQNVTQGIWVDEQFDLFSLVPRPSYLLSISLFASGHDFDSSAVLVSLVAR